MAKKVKEGIQIHGFTRVQLAKDGKIQGDSGWVGPNQITNLGFLNFLVKSLGSSAGSKYVGYIALGTGGAPASDAVTLPGEISASTKRTTVTLASVASTTAQFTATFASSASFLAASSNISNIGLYFSSETNDTLFAGNTYTSSQCSTNQDVYCTYQIRFS